MPDDDALVIRGHHALDRTFDISKWDVVWTETPAPDRALWMGRWTATRGGGSGYVVSPTCGPVAVQQGSEAFDTAVQPHQRYIFDGTTPEATAAKDEAYRRLVEFIKAAERFASFGDT